MKNMTVKTFGCSMILLAGLSISGNAQTVVVSPANMNGWSFVATDDNGALATSSPYTDATGQMVTGPGTPPLGTGSAQLATTAAGGNGASRISTAAYDGVLLSDITALSYATYDTANNGQQFPLMEIAVSTDGSGSAGSEDSLFFEPPYQTPTSGNPALPNQGNTAMNTWQTWNVVSGGLWDNDGKFNPGSGPNGVNSLAAFIALFPNATIMNNIINGGPGNEGITFFVGEDGSTNNGYVDDFTIGTTIGGTATTTTYDFDPSPASAVPEPTTVISGALLLLPFGFSAFRVLRKKIVA